MRFRLGCCCATSSGIYDFWGLGGRTDSVGDFLENETRLSRTPSYQPVITDYLYPDSTQIGNVLPDGNDRVITSYRYGLSFELWTGGEYLDPGYFGAPIPISMYLPNERVWIEHYGQTGNIPTDLFQQSGLSWSGMAPYATVDIGSGARISGHNLVLTLDTPTSGAYIKWNLTDTTGINRLDFDIPVLFDKTLLTTIEEYPSEAKTEHWLKVSATSFNETQYFKYYQTGILTNSGEFFGEPFPDSYLWQAEYTSSGQKNRYINYFPVFPGDGNIKSVELRLVDDTGSYTIDDISGFYLPVVNLRAPIYYPKSSSIVTDRILSYIDGTTGTILYQHKLDKNYNFYSGLTGLDIYTYSQNPPTGFASGSSYFSFINFTDYLRDYNKSQTTINNDTTQYNGIVVQPPLRNVNQSIIGFDNDSTGIVDWDTSNLFDPNYVDDFRTLYLPSIFYYDTPTQLGIYAAWNIDLFNDGGFQLFKSLYPTGYSSLYSSPHYFSLVEYDIPIDEKILIYQNFLLSRTYNTSDTGVSGYFGTYEPLDINNFNSDVQLPRISALSTRDAPNAFSVLIPKQNFIVATCDTNNTLTYPSGLLSQTCKILYGGITQSNFTIQAISGQFLDGTGGGRFDLSGIGGSRPFTTFNYSGLRFASGGELSGLQATGGRVYDFNFDFVYGDPDAEVFWEDSLSQNVQYIPFNSPVDDNTFLYNDNIRTSLFTGIFISPAIPNVTVNLFQGTKHIATNTLGASFIHSYNHYITGSNPNSIDSYSGEAYFKLKIGDNIVFDAPLYGNVGNAPPAWGPFSLHATESNQRSNLSGNYAAFVWFERLYQSQPGPSGFLQNGSVGVSTGWKMHVTNETGLDLWTTGTSGERHWEFAEFPYVMDSSDRYFYVNGFILGYPDVFPVSPSTSYDIKNLYDDSGNATGTIYFVKSPTELSGMGINWGFSHDGRSIIPISNQFYYNVNISNLSGRRFPETGYQYDATYTPQGFSIKNSDLLTNVPNLTDWVKQYPKEYTVITGLNPYLPSGIQDPPDPLDYPYPHALVSSTGFNMANYPGYQILYSGFNWIDLYDSENNRTIPLYIASGQTGVGWL